jgi:RimJ/RimL family protein N-acetyltransferase
MNLEESIKKIILLPLDFNKVGNDQSIYSLLKDAGYFEIYDKVNEENILETLSNHKDWIEYWLAWSENKRGGDGWYLMKKGKNKYVVGRIGFGGENEEYFEFDNLLSGCAVFIKKEIESIRIS